MSASVKHVLINTTCYWLTRPTNKLLTTLLTLKVSNLNRLHYKCALLNCYCNCNNSTNIVNNELFGTCKWRCSTQAMS